MKICPLCEGDGIAPKKKNRRAAVHRLMGSGYTYREIAGLLGMKSPSTVHYYMKQKCVSRKVKHQ